VPAVEKMTFAGFIALAAVATQAAVAALWPVILALR
jgi:hypothetical protein